MKTLELSRRNFRIIASKTQVNTAIPHTYFITRLFSPLNHPAQPPILAVAADVTQYYSQRIVHGRGY